MQQDEIPDAGMVRNAGVGLFSLGGGRRRGRRGWAVRRGWDNT